MSITAAPLIATDVHRTYTIGGHDLPVLRGVNVEVAAGEKIFLCGQSGAGKTTLLYVLGGLEKPTRGDVLVHGKSLYHGSARERATARNRTMGFVFQHYFLLPELTALENVLLPAMKEVGDKFGAGELILPFVLQSAEVMKKAVAHVEQFKTSDGKTLLDSQVQNLVNAMAAFAPPAAGQSTLPAAYATALTPVLAANWQ